MGKTIIGMKKILSKLNKFDLSFHALIQAKVHAEIDGIIGKSEGENESRPITLSDRAAMSYTDAVLHEILRHSCLVYVVQ